MPTGEKLTLKEALQKTLEMEEASKNFYYKLTDRVKGVDEKKALKRLINVKEDYCEFLKTEYRQLVAEVKEEEVKEELNHFVKEMFHIGP